MHHFLFILPLLALALFLYLPIEQALMLFIPIFVVYLILCRLAWRDSRRPVILGAEGMVGGTAQVVSDGGGQLKVLYHGEIWDAVSSDPLCKDDTVAITGVEHMKLLVQRSDFGAAQIPYDTGKRRSLGGNARG